MGKKRTEYQEFESIMKKLDNRLKAEAEEAKKKGKTVDKAKKEADKEK